MIAIVRALDIAVAPIGRTDHHYANCMDVIAVGCRVRKISRLIQTYVDRDIRQILDDSACRAHLL